MGKRGQIKVVLFILCVLTVLVCLLTAYWLENLFFKKLMQPTKKCPIFFPPCMVCPEEGRGSNLGGEGIERGV
jgi:hypothetical protein